MSQSEDSRDVDDLTREIVSNPHFRTVVEESVSRRIGTPREQSSSRRSRDDERQQRAGRFESAHQQLSQLFRRDSRSRRVVTSRSTRPSDHVNHPSQSFRAPSRQRRSRPFAAAKSSSSCNITKEIVLLPDPLWETTLRHSENVSLVEDGFVLNAFPMDKTWAAEISTRL